jgi:RNA polymerase sigma factor (sigma-70 family)
MVTVNGREYQWEPKTGLDTAAVLELKGWIRRVATRYQGRTPREDLEQAGYCGALQAARNFDPSKGKSFLGYADFRIRGEMHHEMDRKAAVTGSLDLAGDTGDGESIAASIADPDSLQAIQAMEDALDLDSLLQGMTRRQREAVGLTLAGIGTTETARRMGVSQNRARVLLGDAIRNAKRQRMQL